MKPGALHRASLALLGFVATAAIAAQSPGAPVPGADMNSLAGPLLRMVASLGAVLALVAGLCRGHAALCGRVTGLCFVHGVLRGGGG